ncbi:unnamed protein product [Adineta steineri]|uniref:MRH domain-containing protein n=2 Tax=Adineta steineri TaxID=433720 RepID=A0A819HUG3_9BILA|nr:unnamed protein product [Adineta steineri]
MRIFKEIHLIFIITFLGVSAKEECDDTKYIVSKCYNYKNEDYQWLIEVPSNKASCSGKSLSEPLSVPCNFACAKGETFDKNTLGCKDCETGTFSLGGGHQYTFDELDGLRGIPTDISLKATSLVSSYETECKKNTVWHVKGNVLQGDVQHNCAISVLIRFKLQRAGAISITYNLPTSYVFATMSSQCDFGTDDKDNDGDDDDDDDNQSDPRKKVDYMLKPTGYGNWHEKTIKIDTAGEYELALYTFGINAFHFPFSIRSIVVEGSAFIQECITCPPGTYAGKSKSSTCTPCPKDTYTADEGSTKCLPCQNGYYADEGSSKCTKRPVCEAKHFQKVFTGCDKSNVATVEYQPIQPKICIGDAPSAETKQSPCGTCNPGMYKNKNANTCEFCPSKTYSNGTVAECVKCTNDLSLVPGLYYKIWNELPMFLKRSYISFDQTNAIDLDYHSQSWIPSIEYISSQAVPDVVSALSLTITKGFRQLEMSKATKEYGTLSFKFSLGCEKSCTLFLVAQDIDDDDADDWLVIHKWHMDKKSEHKDIIDYKYSITSPDSVIFNWLFTSDDQEQGTDEVRIYEILVTNTQVGGSDRCVTCLTTNQEETECKSCTPGNILSNNTCIACPKSTIATRLRSSDPTPTVCVPCPSNTISDDGISCYVPCQQAFNGNIQYDLKAISTIEFHGSKLFTQKGSGYFHVFNATICGNASVTCAKTPEPDEPKRRTNQGITDSKLCRMGSVPEQNSTLASVAYIDEFGEELLNISLSTSKYFPPLRSDYNLTDITLVYRANLSAPETCRQRITYLSLRCDHLYDDTKQNLSLKYKLQTPSDCSTGTCDGCTFQFLLRTPLACPTCDENTNGFRTFLGPCKFGRQEVRKVPYPYCSHKLNEKVEIRRCSMLSLEIEIIVILFIIISIILISLVIMCWRKNRKLEYRYMQLVENANPDDDAPVDNVCAQISDEESGDEIQFKKPSKAKKIMNVVRNAIRKNPNNDQSEFFNGDSFLLTNASKNDA